MSKKVLFSVLILLVLGLAAYIAMSLQPAAPTQTNDTVDVPDVSTDIIWNAYSVNGTAFIYPSDWTFAEVADPLDAKKVTGFTVTYPISSNSFDKIEVGGVCPEITIPEIHNACINGIWLHTQSENEKVLNVFADMQKFGESQTVDGNIKSGNAN